MQSRDMEKGEIFECINQFSLSKEENKELRAFIKKVTEIKSLRRETNQKENDYQYFKRLMLPSDYKKINSDLKQQREYKVDRECYKHETKLRTQGITQEEIEIELKKYRENLCKQYGLSAKGKRKNIVTDEEALSLKDIENNNFIMEE